MHGHADTVHGPKTLEDVNKNQHTSAGGAYWVEVGRDWIWGEVKERNWVWVEVARGWDCHQKSAREGVAREGVARECLGMERAKGTLRKEMLVRKNQGTENQEMGSRAMWEGLGQSWGWRAWCRPALVKNLRYPGSVRPQ